MSETFLLRWLVLVCLGYDAVRLSRVIIEIGLGMRTIKSTLNGKDVTHVELTIRAINAAIHFCAFLAALALLG